MSHVLNTGSSANSNADSTSAQTPHPHSSRLERRAIALMTDTAANALLGIVFWAAAARLYPPSEVGRGSALISTATLLATLSQLNLGNVYARFLGSAGTRKRKLVFVGYGVVACLALLLGTSYALLGATKVLFADAIVAWLFPLAVAILAVFALQDMILVSLHKAAWVPIENIAWGLTKLGLLVWFATVAPGAGVTLAWILPAVVCVLSVTAYLLGRRWNVAADGLDAALAGGPGVPVAAPVLPFPNRSELTRTVAGEYVTGLVSTAVPLVLPLLVVHRLGLEANAYFAVPWLFATSLSLLMWNVASILLVEASSAPHRLSTLLKKALRLSMVVAIAGAVCIWFLGPVLLSVLGAGYAEHSTWLLRITALTAPSIAVVVVWTTASRAQGRLRRVIILQALIGLSVLGLSSALIGSLGVVGIGVAYLTVQTTAALVLIRPLLVLIRSGSRV